MRSRAQREWLTLKQAVGIIVSIKALPLPERISSYHGDGDNESTSEIRYSTNSVALDSRYLTGKLRI